MYTLLIDTHDKDILVCIYKDGRELKHISKESPNNHSNIVMPMLSDLFNSLNIKINDLKQILVINGPGSFTGVRVGVTIAKTIAYCLNIPIKTISSLDMYAVSTDTSSNKLVLLHDFKGAYICLYSKDNRVLDGPFYMSNNDLNKYLKDNDYSKIVIDNKIDLNKVYSYSLNIKNTICHNVNPLYIKEIDALKNDKKSLPTRFE